MQEIHDQEEFNRQYKDLQENERKKAMEDLIIHGNQAFEIVVLPTYKLDERLNVEVEDSHPPEIMFMGLGWHRDEIEKLKIPAGSDMEHDKHYR